MFFKKKKLTTVQIKRKTLRKEIAKRERLRVRLSLTGSFFTGKEITSEIPDEQLQRIEELSEEIRSLKEQLWQVEEVHRGKK